MKKILCAILALAMMLCFTGCDLAALLDEDTTTAPEETGVEFSTGEINGNVYTNEFANITYTAPDGWVFASDDEIADVAGEAVDSEGTAYGMLAMSSDQLNNVQVVFEDTAVTGNRMKPDGYLTILSSQLGTVYEQMGGTYEVSEVKTVKIGAEEYSYIDISVNISGVILEQGYACRKIDDQMVSIVFTAYEDGGVAAQMACFE